ncbi:MAG: type II secretion system protein [Candidatus Kaiserbacteria bacterium]|nr:type II secretion system protein [Candidatus Kaiserbacteria bacterium]
MPSLIRGFSLVEMVITIAIVAVLASASVLSHRAFTSQSALHLRAAEVLEYVQLAQDFSQSSEVLSSDSILPTRGFQVVRIRVRDGLFRSIRLEKVPGAFAGFASDTADASNNFDFARKRPVPGNVETLSPVNERFLTDVCFIDVTTTPRYTRKKIGLSGQGGDDTSCTTAILCSEPDPTSAGYRTSVVAKNNFDILLTIEQPTREVSANVVGVAADGTHRYQYTEPNGPSSLTSSTYEGVRIVFINPEGNKKSVDVYKTGLVSMQADDSGSGCR